MLRLVTSTAASSESLPSGTRVIYREIALYLGAKEMRLRQTEPPIAAVRFSIDILSGTSAGGINAAFLAQALANGQSVNDLRRMWLQEADLVRC